MKRDIFSYIYFLQFFPLRTCALEFNFYTSKKWYFAWLLFFTDSLMRWTFFFSSLSLCRILSLLFCPILIHSINRKKKEREKEPMALLLRVTYIYIYLYTLGRDGGGKNDLILVLYTCALSPFYIPSGMMRKSQKEIHYCSTQVNNVNLYVILDRKKKENTHLFSFFSLHG